MISRGSCGTRTSGSRVLAPVKVIIDSLLVATFRNMLTYTHTIQSSIHMISRGSCGTRTSGSRVLAPVKVIIDSLLVVTFRNMLT